MSQPKAAPAQSATDATANASIDNSHASRCLLRILRAAGLLDELGDFGRLGAVGLLLGWSESLLGCSAGLDFLLRKLLLRSQRSRSAIENARAMTDAKAADAT